MKPWILIPVHNRRDTTLACLRQLRANGDLESCEVLVIDDGSTDGTSGAVSTEFPQVRLAAGDGTLWWTGAIARGMEIADRAGAEVVLWLNDDCQPRRGALDALLACLSTHPQTVATPTCVLKFTGRRVPSGFCGRQSVTAQASEIAWVDGTSGFCVALPRALWETIGWPDAKRFPHFAGDTEYTLRAGRAGWKIALLGNAVLEIMDDRSHGRKLGSEIRRDLPWREEYVRLFVHTKSPWRLATQMNLLQLKYGWLLGSALGAARALSWSAQFCLARAGLRKESPPE